tara:strand:+ start:1898 stop:2419 length:522 start_codon:yes stop_codon:yes gene_type:complete
MANLYFLIFKRFIFFALIQGFIFNNFNFLGSFNPYIALVFLLTFPIKTSKITFMIISFCFGFSLDLFSNSLGINTAACLTLAFSRSYVLNFVFGSFYDPYGTKVLKNYISESTYYQQFLYLISLILIHHSVLFLLESFSLKFLSLVIYKTLITSFLSILFCATTIYIMIKNEK